MLLGEGGPFGAVVARDGYIVGEGWNRVTSSNDPTAHAEIVAIREACRRLGSFSLAGCDLYTSCEPCPMCLGAIYWARLDRIFYANTTEDAAAIGFDDSSIAADLERPRGDRRIPMTHLDSDIAAEAFREWQQWPGRTPY